ncbi:hypothetical protein CTAM01_03530 [Colletotrichum tamarilloi]|uniref:Uncharacterized protein n=1 Tax=Colletotrichum tamarilloi TaxID=1209934 RepID=A0ABQ9RJY2_9PEZI|nr:uncharacterized protein CTAM01_03530 [Colletotrichum tamarilloi]KAK1506195.1 hypothetical protein CTAM01_03530 [Colletotrichum tamarilloi]
MANGFSGQGGPYDDFSCPIPQRPSVPLLPCRPDKEPMRPAASPPDHPKLVSRAGFRPLPAQGKTCRDATARATLRHAEARASECHRLHDPGLPCRPLSSIRAVNTVLDAQIIRTHWQSARLTASSEAEADFHSTRLRAPARARSDNIRTRGFAPK